MTTQASRSYPAYSNAELVWMEANRTLPADEYHNQFCKIFGRFVSSRALARKRLYYGWKTDRQSGTTKHKIGDEVIKRGVLCRRINDGYPALKRWKAVHKIRWEELHGEIPRGMRLRCKTDPMNTDPSNWDLIDTAIVLTLNGANGRMKYAEAPRELKPALLAIAQLEHAARKISIQKKGIDHSFDLDEKIYCVEQELHRRRCTYPNQIKRRILTQAEADRAIACMAAIVADYRAQAEAELLP